MSSLIIINLIGWITVILREVNVCVCGGGRGGGAVYVCVCMAICFNITILTMQLSWNLSELVFISNVNSHMYLFHSSVFITQYAKDKPDYKLQGLMYVQLCIQLISCGLYSTVLYTSLWTFISTEFLCFEVQVFVWEKKLNYIHCHAVKQIYDMCAIYNFMKIHRAIMTMKYTNSLW